METRCINDFQPRVDGDYATVAFVLEGRYDPKVWLYQVTLMGETPPQYAEYIAPGQAPHSLVLQLTEPELENRNPNYDMYAYDYFVSRIMEKEPTSDVNLSGGFICSPRVAQTCIATPCEFSISLKSPESQLPFVRNAWFPVNFKADRIYARGVFRLEATGPEEQRAEGVRLIRGTGEMRLVADYQWPADARRADLLILSCKIGEVSW